MKVLFFAQTREVAGCERAELDLGLAITESEVWAKLIEAFPGLAVYRKTARLACREAYLQSGEKIQPDDEIAVIPPVSGG